MVVKSTRFKQVCQLLLSLIVGKRTLSLPRLRCSLDVILVVTFPPFWFASCSVVSTYLVDWRNFFFPHTASVLTYPLAVNLAYESVTF